MGAPLPRREGWWALLFLAVSLLVYGRVLFLDAALFGRDVLHHYWPMREGIKAALLEGRLPQWDPSVQAGLPVLGNIHTGVFYPPNLLFLPLSFPRAYALTLWLHHALFGMGLFLWARRTFAVGPALISALAVMLSGLTLSLNNYGPMMCGIAWVPWVLFAWTSPASASRRAALVGLVLALQACSGDPMSTLYSGLLLGSEVAFSPRRRLSDVGWLSVAAVAGVLLAGVQLAPGAVAWAQSSRQGGEHGAGLFWSMHPVRLLELLLPNPFGYYLEAPYFWGQFMGNAISRLPFNLTLFSGAAVLALALQGVRKDRFTAQWLTVAGVGAVLALGANGPAAGLLSAVPPFSFFRFPEKYWLLTIVALALFAGRGLGLVLRGDRSWGRLAPLIILAAAAWLSSSVLGQWAATRWLQGKEVELATRTLGDAARTSLFALAPVCVLLAAQSRLKTTVMVACCAAVLCLELLSANLQVVWTAPSALYQPPVELAESLTRLSPTAPFRHWRDSKKLEYRGAGPDTYQSFAVKRAWEVFVLKPNLGALVGQESLSGVSPVILADWEVIAIGLYPQRARLFALFNVCAGLSAPDDKAFLSDPGFEPPVVLAEGPAIFRVKRCGARVHSVKRLLAAPDARAALSVLKAPAFDPWDEAAVAGPARDGLADVAVSDLEVRPELLRAKALASADGFLVFAMSWYPGWTVQVDGAEVPVVRANGAQFGVAIPPGAHTVEARFRDPGLTFGLLMSGLGTALLISLWKRQSAVAV